MWIHMECVALMTTRTTTNSFGKREPVIDGCSPGLVQKLSPMRRLIATCNIDSVKTKTLRRIDPLLKEITCKKQHMMTKTAEDRNPLGMARDGVGRRENFKASWIRVSSVTPLANTIPTEVRNQSRG